MPETGAREKAAATLLTSVLIEGDQGILGSAEVRRLSRRAPYTVGEAPAAA